MYLFSWRLIMTCVTLCVSYICTNTFRFQQITLPVSNCICLLSDHRISKSRREKINSIKNWPSHPNVQWGREIRWFNKSNSSDVLLNFNLNRRCGKTMFILDILIVLWYIRVLYSYGLNQVYYINKIVEISFK